LTVVHVSALTDDVQDASATEHLRSYAANKEQLVCHCCCII